MPKRYAIIGDIVGERMGDNIVPGAGAAIGLALRELGGEITIRSRIGNDEPGVALLQRIKAARIHPKNIDVVEGATGSLVRHEDGSFEEFTPGVLMTKDGVMDIYALFGHNALVLDLLDQPLRMFLIDLPAHTDGTVRMLTTLRHLDHLDARSDELEIAMRCDTIVGTEQQFLKLTRKESASDAFGEIYDQMPFTQLRAAIMITDGGIDCLSRDGRLLRPVQDAVPEFLMPQVVAGISWGMAHHAEWDAAITAALDPESVV